MVLPQLLLLKRVENFTKTVAISMIDSIKRALLGKDFLRTLQIGIKARIEYSEGEETGITASRSSSAKPFDATSNTKRSSGFSSNIANSTSGRKNSVKKETKSSNNRGSIFVMKDKNQKMEELDEFGEPEKSFIDSIFGEEHVSDYNDVAKTLNDFIQDINQKSSKLQEIQDPNELKEKAKEFIPQLFNLQKVYYQEFNKANSTNKKLREFLVKYNEKFREIFKKSNRLHECLESNQIRNEMATFIIREENKKINNAILMNNKELEIYKSLFNIKYTQQDLANYKKNNENNDEARDKNLILKVVQNLFNKNHNSLGKLPDEKKIHLSYIVSKYKLKKSEDGSEENLKLQEINENQGNINLIKINT